MAIEEPKYTVISKNDSYEVREYNSVIVAETQINADFDKAGNQAFRILADYIFGNNKSQVSPYLRGLIRPFNFGFCDVMRFGLKLFSN